MSEKRRVSACPFPFPLPLYKEPNLPILGFFFTNPLPQILRKEKYLYFAFLSSEPQATFNAFLLSLRVCKSISSTLLRTFLRLTHSFPSFLFLFLPLLQKIPFFFFLLKWGNSNLWLILLKVLESLEGSTISSRMLRLSIAQNSRQYYHGDRAKW